MSCKPKLVRSGFTLVELLVVIAIIGVLVALLLPAIQAAREAARRAQCVNNLKQLAIAMHLHHDTYGRFPNAYWYDTGVSNGNWGWAVRLFPFMEQTGLHNALNPGNYQGGIPPVNGTTQTKVPGLICPSDPTGNLNPYALNDGKCNYLLSAQMCDAPRLTPACVGIRMVDITDGTGCTFLIGERDTKDGIGGIWVGLRHTITNAVVYARADLPLNTKYVGASDPNCTRHAWRSQHPGGANFAMGDASIHFIADTIESHAGYTNSCAEIVNTADFLYQNVYRRNDGRTVQVP